MAAKSERAGTHYELMDKGGLYHDMYMIQSRYYQEGVLAHMKKNGRTFLDDIKLINRGINEFEIFLPGQLKWLFIYSAITMLIPYIGIYMTSVVISELSSQQRVWVLTVSVNAAIMLTLILTIVSGIYQ